MNGADYSFARPGGAALAGAGISSVGRYLGDPGDGRCLTASEYADLTSHGIDVWLIREAGGQEMLGGNAAGVQQAQIAQAAIQRLGLPADSAVYFTADFAVQPSQYGACDDYLRGAASVLGSVDRVGVYAGVPYLIHVKGWGGAAYWWKPGASSWSAGQSTPVHLEQLVGSAAGISGTDANIIHESDHGQIGGTMPTAQEVAEAVWVYALGNQGGQTVNGKPPVFGRAADWLTNMSDFIGQIRDAQAKVIDPVVLAQELVKAGLTVDADKVAAAVQAAVLPEFQNIPPQVAALLAQKLA